MNLTWRRVTLLLCTFGLLKEFRPSESFVTQYFVEVKNFTVAQINEEIYPVGTYSQMGLSLVVLILTDILLYKPIIILEGLAGVFTYSLLIWGKNVLTMQAVEFFYGLFMATDVAYFTYLYALTCTEDYQKVSSYARIAFLLGRFFSGIVSQLAVSLQWLDYHQLNYLTLGATSLSVIFAVSLPFPRRGIYFHQQKREINERIDFEHRSLSANHEQPLSLVPVPGNSSRRTNCMTNTMMGFSAMCTDFKLSYSNIYVIEWSLWWAIATCGYLQATSYIQVLWEVTNNEAGGNLFYNGAVDAAYTLLGAIAAWIVGKKKMNLKKHSEQILILCSLFDGILLIVCASTRHLWVQYVLYVIFKISYHTMMTLASSEVAKSLSQKCQGLIFGCNMFVALILQTVLTFLVTSRSGFRLEVRLQYLVYGSYFIILAGGFASKILIQFIMKRFVSKPIPEVEAESL